jgi:hypothetical protein
MEWKHASLRLRTREYLDSTGQSLNVSMNNAVHVAHSLNTRHMQSHAGMRQSDKTKLLGWQYKDGGEA